MVGLTSYSCSCDAIRLLQALFFACQGRSQIDLSQGAAVAVEAVAAAVGTALMECYDAVEHSFAAGAQTRHCSGSDDRFEHRCCCAEIVEAGAVAGDTEAVAAMGRGIDFAQRPFDDGSESHAAIEDGIVNGPLEVSRMDSLVATVAAYDRVADEHNNLALKAAHGPEAMEPVAEYSAENAEEELHCKVPLEHMGIVSSQRELQKSYEHNLQQVDASRHEDASHCEIPLAVSGEVASS